MNRRGFFGWLAGLAAGAAAAKVVAETAPSESERETMDYDFDPYGSTNAMPSGAYTIASTSACPPQTLYFHRESLTRRRKAGAR